jgi:hypothetical protein
MFEAYKIGVRIGVIDGTRGSILKLAMQFAKAQKEASAFLDTLRAVNEELRRPSSWASSAASDFRNARREAEGYARATRSARSAGSGSSGAVGGGLVAVSAGMAAAGRGSGGGWGGGVPLLAGSSGGGPRLLGMAGGALAGRGSGGGWGGSGGGSANGGGMGAFAGVAGGMLTAEAGRSMLGMLGGPIDEAADYQQAVARFSLYGLTDKLNNDAIKFATSMNIVGTSMTQAVDFMTEAQGVFRESGLSGPEALAGAKLAAPVLAKIDYATASLDSSTRAKMATQSMDMMRFIESYGGLSSPQRFNQLANEGWKAIRSSGGNVNWSQLRQFLSTSSVAGKGLSDTALFGEMEPIIGELKGGAAGQGLMTSFSRMNGLQRLMPRIFQHEVLRLGLWDRSKLTFNSQGGIKDISGNPLSSAGMMSTDPVQWYEKVVLPAYKKAGITQQNDIFRENAVLFGNTGSKLFSLIYQQQANIANSVMAQQKTLGIDASVDASKGTYAGQLQDYHAKMKDLQIELGTTILPMLIDGLKTLNPLLKSFANWMHDNPGTVRVLAAAFASLGATLLIGGALKTVTSGLSLLGGTLTRGSGGLVSSLTGATNAMKGLSITAAAFAGWYLGSKISDALDSSSARDTGGTEKTWGGYLYDRYHPFNSKTGKRELNIWGGMWATGADIQANNDAESRWMRSTPKAQAIQVNSTINLSGKAIATAVTQHQVNAATGPQTGTSGFDSSMFASPIGMNTGF